MSWVLRGGVHVWDGEPFPEPVDPELQPYTFCAIPLEERPRPTCGKVTSGRRVHTKHGEPMCPLCTKAEREYQQIRRDLGLAS